MNDEKRQITDHHDGFGLNDKIRIVADEPDASGAAHKYRLMIQVDSPPEGLPAGEHVVAEIQFQKGPRDHVASTPGITEAALVAVLIDRLRGFQGGPFACRENALMLTKLEEALHWTEHRAKARAKRGVLGKAEK